MLALSSEKDEFTRSGVQDVQTIAAPVREANGNVIATTQLPALGCKITYEITRWDLLRTLCTSCMHNRVIQVLMLVSIAFLEFLVLGNMRHESVQTLVFAGVSVLIGFSIALLLVGVPVMFAMAFLFKHRGVLGQHTLEITERGLLEITDYNETLTRWGSICRVKNSRWFLYIYVTDLQFHPVPKRCFTNQQLAEFESGIRARQVR